MKMLFATWFYDLAIRAYSIGIFVASWFNKKAKLWRLGRQVKLPVLPPKKGNKLWFHCASLGEFEQARPVIESWRASNPNDVIILSFFSPSGYEVRKNYSWADAVVYLPLDTKREVQRFLDWARPDLALFVKYEFWFHHLNELKKRNIPLLLFSAVFIGEQVFFKWYGGFFRYMLRLFSVILVQDERSKELLNNISTSSKIVYDTRFDRVYKIATERKAFPLIQKFKGEKNILIAGSTWSKDEQLILALMNSHGFSNFKYIIAPHNIDSNRVRELQKKMPLRSELLSRLNESNAENIDVLLVDSMGDLASIYAYGDFAFIGGGFNAGIHNVLEAAVYGIPVIFGPNYHKSLEAVLLISQGGASSVSSPQNMIDSIQKFMKTGGGKTNKKFVADRLRGTDAVMNEIKILLEKAKDSMQV